MGLYNSIFGVNPVSGVLLAILGLDTHDVGRFRDTYITLEGNEPIIAVYTRNGGGNREECWCLNDNGGYQRCKHHEESYEADEVLTLSKEEYEAHPEHSSLQPGNMFIGLKRTYRTGRRVTEVRYVCEAPESAECACPACAVNHRMPAHPDFIRAEDDEFDSTYNTAYFRAPADYHDLLAGLAREGNPNSDWQEFLAFLSNAPEDLTPEQEARLSRAEQFGKQLFEQLGLEA